LKQNGRYVDVRYDWKIVVEKPLLKYFSPIMKPIFAANHRWAMAKGEQSLELARRHARTPHERAEIPVPPPPITSSPLPLLLATVGVVGVSVGLIRLVIRAMRG
jgi:hypothetical protein